MIKEDKYGLKDIQDNLFKVLKDFHDFCTNNNIHYSAFSGTLLGAVREKGFIPWDDDIDVAMDVENYSLLKKCLQDNQDYYLDLYDAWVPRFRNKHIAQGPFIDVFILTDAPKGIENRLTIFRLKALQGMLKKYSTVKDISLVYKLLIVITKALGKMFPRQFLLDQYWKIGYGKKRESDYYFAPNVGFGGLNKKWKKDKLDLGYTELDFESMKIEAFIEYDYVLRIIFGDDYMTPVIESDRIAYHSNQINNERIAEK